MTLSSRRSQRLVEARAFGAAGHLPENDTAWNSLLAVRCVMSRTADIRLSVQMDDDGIEAIHWEADEGPAAGEQSASAMLLALWDEENRNALRIDLWTKEMSVDDMNDFFFQTLLTLGDTYRNATNDASLASEIKLFARDFAEKAAKTARRNAGSPAA